MEQFIGEIRPFGFTYAPKGWALCNGQILPIQSNTALFSIIGNNFGGNGTTTFALPNIQGYVLVGAGQMTGGSMYDLGAAGGAATVTLTNSEMPAHNHTFNGATTTTINPPPASVLLTTPTSQSFIANCIGKTSPTATSGTLGRAYDPTTSNLVPLNPSAVGINGGNQPHDNMAPYLVINYCIAITGIFPPRP